MHIELPRRRRALVSLTPLIDVVFILLVFFMLASSFLDWRAIGLNVPAGGEIGLEHDASLEVRIGADGQLSLEGRLLDLDTLAAEIAQAVAEQADRPVVVRPAGSVRLQEMVDVVERLAAAGAANVALRPE
jgi:biopolymer transport protein ExbD